MDNPKFMDLWPEWLRWVLLLPIALIPVSTFAFVVSTVNYGSYLVYCTLVALVSFLYLWFGVATAPRSKWIVGIVLVVASFIAASIFFYPLWPHFQPYRSGNLFGVFSFLIDFNGQAYASGIALSCIALSWAWLRRLNPPAFFQEIPSLTIGSALFVGLSIWNVIAWINAFVILSPSNAAPGFFEKLNELVFWLIGREVLLIAAAVMGVLFLARHGRTTVER